MVGDKLQYRPHGLRIRLLPTIENAENILADIALKRLVQLHVADIVGFRLFHDLLTALHRIMINRPSVFPVPLTMIHGNIRLIIKLCKGGAVPWIK